MLCNRQRESLADTPPHPLEEGVKGGGRVEKGGSVWKEGRKSAQSEEGARKTGEGRKKKESRKSGRKVDIRRLRWKE